MSDKPIDNDFRSGRPGRLGWMAQRLRRAMLCVELELRGLTFCVGGDEVSVLLGVLWFDVCPLRGMSGWAVDYPHLDFEDEHCGIEIARTDGVLFPVRVLVELANSRDYSLPL
ncbi:hypothetical protein AB0L82_43250 [Nocardia sp. NPDC052001]|uniref:hypothetical protein n=1 Tax=Nocardia sp. NPDC052001 TaxID=3154853 RepID=UPI003445178D